MLEQLLPNIRSGLQGTGFLFGAGVSVEAGYPMMSSLTRTVIGLLRREEADLVEEVLGSSGWEYDPATGTPNIEVIADCVLERAISAGCARCSVLEATLRAKITEVILSIKNPALHNHVKFLEALKARAFGRPACVHIFTTNYDCLFEFAGAVAGVVIETGFSGSVDRFFDPKRFSTLCGTQSASRFEEHAVLTVRLVKLHGSVSWFNKDDKVIERHPDAIPEACRRIMILPRRRKVMDTLYPPHDLLFGVASRALGPDCKYLVSCGFSYGDAHINDTLLLPNLSAGRIRLFACCEHETDGMAALKGPAFSASFKESSISGADTSSTGTNYWKFSEFVDLFTRGD